MLNTPPEVSQGKSKASDVKTRSTTTRAPGIRSSLAGLTNRSNSGLGRGLDGILGDALVAEADSRLLQLIGGHHAEPVREIRQFVADTAVGVLASKFGAESVWLATAEASGPVSLISTHLPPNWSHLAPNSLEISGRLWSALSAETGYRQISLAHRCLWVCSQRFDQPFAVVVTRPDLFDVAEQRTLSRFLRSVSVAIGNRRSDETDPDISVLLQQAHQSVTAEVAISSGRERRTARRESSSGPLATAAAAAALCNVPCTVAYAGQVSLQQYAVNMVVVLDDDEAPLIGLSVAVGEDPAGPARAVFSSLASVAGKLFEGPG